MKVRRRGRAAVVSAMAVGVGVGMPLAGCGSSHETLNTVPVERAIEASIRTQRGLTTAVHCPAKVPLKAGQGFTCFAKLEVGAYPVAVTEKDGAGHVRYNDAAPLVALDVAHVQSAIAASILAQRHLTATVRCPATVLQQAGLKFVCTARVAGTGYPFVVEQVDSSGHVRYLGR